MQFEPGDTIKVQSWHDGIKWNDIDKVVGKTFVLGFSDISKDGYIFPNNNKWMINVPLSAVKLIKKGNNMKLKAGDKVKIVRIKSTDATYRVGDTGVLLNDQDIKMDVRPGGPNGAVDYYELEKINSNSLAERINALENIGREAFEIMAEIGGEYYITIPTVPSTYRGMCLCDRNSMQSLKVFDCDNPCQVGDAYKKALLFIAEREGKLGPKVGDEVKADIEGKVYKVKILQEV